MLVENLKDMSISPLQNFTLTYLRKFSELSSFDTINNYKFYGKI